MTNQDDKNLTPKQLAQYIDHTLLKPEATEQQIITLCNEAITHSLKGVCVNGQYIETVSNLLKGTSSLPVCVIGFPLGSGQSKAKAFEAELAVKSGAQEIDMVIALGHLKSGYNQKVFEDIKQVVAAINKPLKVILETGLLSDEEIVTASKISVDAGAAFIKTCTGFNVGSAKVEHIELIRRSIPKEIKIKASGGIKTSAQAIELIKAGADRLGTSSGVALVTGSVASSGY